MQMSRRTRCRRDVVAAALLIVFSLTTSAAHAAQQPPTSADPEARDDRPAAVMLDGQPVFWVTTPVGPYSTEFRADRISKRIDSVLHDWTIRDPSAVVVESEDTSEVRVGTQLIMVVTGRDAESMGMTRPALAAQYARAIEDAIRAERLRYTPEALLRSGLYGLATTIAFALFVWIAIRTTRTLGAAVRGRMERHAQALRVMQHELVPTDRVWGALRMGAVALLVVVIAVAADLYLTFLLGLFPWTRAISHQILGYVFSPVRAITLALAGYLPKFLFLIIIIGFVTLGIRIVGVFFRQIRVGRLTFASFPPEWADPTNKIARVLLIALGAVVAFPYLPASSSPAFAGVSVFMGVLVSLASSSALANIMAGTVLTYTGAFRLGDRVKIADAFGDIIGTSLLATRIRTIKNEEVTIPNSIALGSAVINYTRESQTRGLILHTTITIGYDAPWRRVHDLLVEAALATPEILTAPAPFVWQTALNDFYVTYEINAYTGSPQTMVDTYAALHAQIQDAFYAAGVEIMSPHYTSVRDGNTIAVPEAFRPADYQARRFRVEATAPSGAARTDPSAERVSAPADLPRRPAS